MGTNDKDYDINLKKIAFMTEGPAKAWADQYTENALTQNQTLGLNLGIYLEFRKALTNTFSAYNTLGDALKNLRIKPEEDIDFHIMKYVTLLSESRLDKNSPAVVNFFRETLPVKLQVKIMNLETPPKDIDGWYKWAKKFDNTAKRTRAIIGILLQNLKTNKLVPQYYLPPWEHNLNTMDVDALFMEERG